MSAYSLADAWQFTILVRPADRKLTRAVADELREAAIEAVEAFVVETKTRGIDIEITNVMRTGSQVSSARLIQTEKRCHKCQGAHDANPLHPHIDCWCSICHPVKA